MEHIEGKYLVHRHLIVLQFKDDLGIAELTGSDLVQFFSPLVHSVAYDSARETPKLESRVSLTGEAGKIILRFLNLYFDQIRELICKGNKQSLGATTHGVLIALGGWLSSHLGVGSHVATAAASAILIAIVTATKGTFCKMTASEAKKAFDNAARSRPK